MSRDVAPEEQVMAFDDTLGVVTDSRQQTEACAVTLAQREAPAEWLLATLKRIRELLFLGENWDSYGARAVHPGAVRAALAVAERLSRWVGVPVPAVTATGDGHVGFCWDEDEWSLDASVDDTGLVTYVFLNESRPQDDIEARTRNADNLLHLLTRWAEA